MSTQRHHVPIEIEAIHEFGRRGIRLISLTEPFLNVDATTPMGEAIIGIMAVLAQLRVSTIRENTRRGLVRARAQGRVVLGSAREWASGAGWSVLEAWSVGLLVGLHAFQGTCHRADHQYCRPMRRSDVGSLLVVWHRFRSRQLRVLSGALRSVGIE
ncbi:recombinase family protein [Actinomyces mediterranea]|uniref:recombinase family protein n=1 Tax=Actinomyces mediterranea TaxID=1871028 RepID=UPI0009F88842|nr:recombinase family protein [Actinomyces mediterranea]